MALAARYKCDIYMLSLLDRNMYDQSLLNLFNSLPQRALVLLEDIDSAGLNRELITNTDGRQPATQVTLSGLLNAIDGVDSPEGHILIMTSNDPDSLDEALVRSGRVSVKVAFRKATPAQSRDIFLRMYQEDVDEQALSLSKVTIEQLASDFASKLPDNEFSPADLQDYMLMRKSQPQRAVNELTEWVEQILKERAEEAEELRKEKEEKEKDEEKKKKKRAKSAPRVIKDSPEEVYDESYYSNSNRISDEDL
jgi:mitochondrial chaperone BCS1